MSWIDECKGAGPWKFTPQGDKDGYLNNPLWVPKAEAAKIHSPCGYWHRGAYYTHIYSATNLRTVAFPEYKFNSRIAITPDFRYLTSAEGFNLVWFRMEDFFTNKMDFNAPADCYNAMDTVVSRDGKYQFICYNAQDGLGNTTGRKVLVSSDYGLSWENTLTTTFSGDLSEGALACSDGGQKVIFIAGVDLPWLLKPWMFISSDYGQTWTAESLTVGFHHDTNISISGDGNHYLCNVLDYNYPDPHRNRVIYDGIKVPSQDDQALSNVISCATTQDIFFCTTRYYKMGEIYKNNERITTAIGDMSYRAFKDIVVARDNTDIIMAVVGSDTPSNNCVWITHDGGVNWAKIPLTTSQNNYQLHKAAISEDGKYIVVTCENENPWYSNDYGYTFKKASGILPGAYYDADRSVSLSKDGKYGLMGFRDAKSIYFTEDYGVTWNKNNIMMEVIEHMKIIPKGFQLPHVVWPFSKV